MHESAELRELIAAMFRALSEGDAEFFTRHLVNGPQLRLIGSAADEWFGGGEAFAMLRDQIAGGPGTITASAEQIEAYADGDIGWAAAVVRYRAGERTVVGRETFVFRRSDGVWQLVQSHTSFPVDTESLFS